MGLTYRSTLRPNIQRMQNRMHEAVSELMAHEAARGEASMKTRAPWTDRTGAARTTLTANAASDDDGHTITFAHGVTYGIYLEVSNGGRYQIIMPTVQLIGDELQQQLDGLLGRIG